jgi:peptidoglycan hydrolase-like protein with peptidoglycan-binding domain
MKHPTVVRLLSAIAMVAVVVPSVVQAQTSGAAPGVITGYVTDGANHFVKHVALEIFAYGLGGKFRSGVFNEATGAYTIDLPAGDWYVGAHAIDPNSGFTGSRISAPISIHAGEKRLYDIALTRLGGVIEGKIEKEGGSLKSAVINLVSTVAGVNVPSLSSEVVGGSYRLFVPAGSYSLTAFASPKDNVVNPQVQKIVVANGDYASLSLIFKQPDGEISGTVLPLGAGASVFAVSEKGEYAEAVADQNGNFTVKVRRGSSWTVSAWVQKDSVLYRSKPVVVPLASTSQGAFILLNLTSVSLLPGGKSVNVSADKDAFVSLANSMAVSIPQGTLPSGSGTLAIKPTATSPYVANRIVGPAYDISFVGSSGKALQQVSKRDLVVELPYTAADIAAAGVSDESKLKAAFWDATVSAWRVNESSVADPKRRVVIGFTNFLARVTVVDPEPQEVQIAPPPPASSGGSTFAPVSSTPLTPTNLAAAALSSTGITLTWTDNASNESQYIVERSLQGPTGSFSVLADQLPPNTTTFTNTNLSPKTFYTYRIRAVENVGGKFSNYSDIVSATTFSSPLATPETPTSLTASVLSSSAVKLDWIDNATNETRYAVEQSTNGNPFTQITNALPADTKTFTVTSLSPLTPYSFRVQAINGSAALSQQLSEFSNSASITTLSNQGPNAAPPPPAPSLDGNKPPTGTTPGTDGQTIALANLGADVVTNPKIATVSWTTKLPATSALVCTSGSQQFSFSQANFILVHAYTVSLTPGAAYSCTATVQGAAGEVGSGTITFTAPAAAQSALPSGALSQGASGTAVTQLQNALKAQGFLAVNATGFFGPATAAALSAFQAENGLPVTGVADQETLAKINEKAAALPVSVSPPATLPVSQKVQLTQNLQLGSSGSQVIALQQFLIAKGYLVLPSGVQPGLFGALTRTAVIKYQIANSISPAAGFVGLVTRSKINATP